MVPKERKTQVLYFYLIFFFPHSSEQTRRNRLNQVKATTQWVSAAFIKLQLCWMGMRYLLIHRRNTVFSFLRPPESWLAEIWSSNQSVWCGVPRVITDFYSTHKHVRLQVHGPDPHGKMQVGNTKTCTRPPWGTPKPGGGISAGY